MGTSYVLPCIGGIVLLKYVGQEAIFQDFLLVNAKSSGKKMSFNHNVVARH